MENEINYNRNKNKKFIDDNINHKFKDDNSNFLKEKQKIQPPKQVLELNARRNNNKNINDSLNFNDSNISKTQENNPKPKVRERKINRYYYRSKERKGDKRRERIQDINNEKEKEKEPSQNIMNEVNISPKNNNIYNNKRKLRSEKREMIRKKLTALIKKIDSHKIKDFSFNKWKKVKSTENQTEIITEKENNKK